MTTSQQNPVEARFEMLEHQWAAFADDPHARLLHWVLEADEWKMVELFLETDERPKAPDDLFLSPALEFVNGDSFAAAVIEWFELEYAKAREELAAEGLDTSWQTPAQRPGQTQFEWLAATLDSFHQFHQPLYRHLVIALTPTQVSDTREFERWIELLIDALHSPNVRFIAIDYRQTLALAAVAQSRATRVRTVIAGLNMPAAYLEVSLSAGIDSPEGKFRHHYVEMLTLLDRDRPRAQELGMIAEGIAVRHGWHHLAFSVRYALGSGHLHANDPAEAIREYRIADEIAGRLFADGEKLGRALQLRAQMAMGTACFMAQAFEPAASVFEDATEIAIEVEEAVFVLECLRMACLCHSRSGKIDLAWEAGTIALLAGSQMAAKDREVSTLPFLGLEMLALTQYRQYSHHQPAIDAQMSALIGEDWRERATPGELPAAWSAP